MNLLNNKFATEIDTCIATASDSKVRVNGKDTRSMCMLEGYVNDINQPSHQKKKTICLCKNEDAGQLCSNFTAYQCLCFCTIDSKMNTR